MSKATDSDFAISQKIKGLIEELKKKAKNDGLSDNTTKMKELFEKAQKDMRGKEEQFTYFLCAIFGLFSDYVTDEAVQIAYLIEENREK